MAKKGLVPQIQNLNRTTSESLLKHTGKNWDQWIAILNKNGAFGMSHKEIVAFLHKRHKVTPWWQQIISTGFEIHIGRRQEGRNAKGELSTISTKTFYISAEKLWDLLESEQGQAVWLKPLSPFKFKTKNVFETEDGFYGEIRTMRDGERLRMSWQDPEWTKPTILQVYALPREKGKSVLVFMHDSIRETRTKARLKERWSQAVEELAALAGAKPPRRKKSD